MKVFESDLQNDFAKMKPRKSLSSFEYTLPAKVEKVCFIDDRTNSTLLDDYPIIKNAVDEGAGTNVYVIDDENEAIPLQVDDLKIAIFPYFICLPSKGNVLSVKIEGRNNDAYLIPPPDDKICKTAENMAQCDHLNVFYDDYRQSCCQEYGSCC
jgi:hypothetical protein